ncbi:hypothetical protein JX266_005473 [Neoarthrinium moseri]|nr:hypothetical protein JX266_005473 [Neoarthrinium moseri]
MFRGLWKGWRSLPSAQARFNSTPNQSQFRANVIRLLRNNGARSLAARPRPKNSSVLYANIYGSIYLSIALLVTDDSLDWLTRRHAGVEAVQEITLAKDFATKTKNFWALGPALLHAYSGKDVEHHEGLQPTEESGMVDELEVRLMTVPDPDDSDTTLFLCQATFKSEAEPEFYVATRSNRMEDAAYSLMPSVDKVNQQHLAARGLLLLLYPDGSFHCLYYDGRRWLNLLFLEWQTAESMGFR